jgi:hypothetical protein
MKRETKIKFTTTTGQPVDSRTHGVTFRIKENNDGMKIFNKNGHLLMDLDGQECLAAFPMIERLAATVVPPSENDLSVHNLVTNQNLSDVILTFDTFDAFISAVDSMDKKYLNDIRDKKFRKQDLPISSRVLNDWTYQQGLLNDDRENKEQWRTFSSVEKAYVHILQVCREFGVSVRKLQKARESFDTKLKGRNISIIEIAYAYFDKKKDSGDIYLVMDNIGRSNIIRAEDIALMAQEKRISNHFILNLNEVWNEK